MPSLAATLGIYTKPPPGECDGGRFIECCTDVAGRTECAATALGWAIPGVGLAVAARRQATARQWAEPPRDPTEKDYLEAKAAGYAGTSAEFVEEWQREGIEQKEKHHKHSDSPDCGIGPDSLARAAHNCDGLAYRGRLAGLQIHLRGDPWQSSDFG